MRQLNLSVEVPNSTKKRTPNSKNSSNYQVSGKLLKNTLKKVAGTPETILHTETKKPIHSPKHLTDTKLFFNNKTIRILKESQVMDVPITPQK